MYPPGLLKIDSYQRDGICRSRLHGGEPHSAYFLLIFSETWEVKMPCPCLVMFLGSNISIVSVRQTENERLLKMRKGIRTQDAVKPGRNIGQSVEMLPLPKWDGALPGSKERDCQNSSVHPLGGIPGAGRGRSPRRRGGRPSPSVGCSPWNRPAAGDVISADTNHKARLLTLVFQFWQTGNIRKMSFFSSPTAPSLSPLLNSFLSSNYLKSLGTWDVFRGAGHSSAHLSAWKQEAYFVDILNQMRRGI